MHRHTRVCVLRLSLAHLVKHAFLLSGTRVYAHLSVAVYCYGCTATTAATFLWVHLCGSCGWVWEWARERTHSLLLKHSFLISEGGRAAEEKERMSECMSKQKWRLETRTARQQHGGRLNWKTAVDREWVRESTEERTRAREEVERWRRTVRSPSTWLLIDAKGCGCSAANAREGGNGREGMGENGQGKNRRSKFKFHLQVIKFHGPNWVCLYSG